MSDKLESMDVFGKMFVPFEVAAYCRSHYLTTYSISLAKQIKLYEAARTAASQAAKAEEDAEEAMRQSIENVRAVMRTRGETK